MKLTELFHSFQGEGAYTGYPMTFIRVTGCPVGCPFCDTDYTYGEPRTIDEIISQIKHSHVCVTGGEPLVHPEIEDLLEAIMLETDTHRIHIETSGCYSLPDIILNNRRLFWITVSPKGKFLGAKKDFKEEVLLAADEIKWIVPGAPIELIKRYRFSCPNVYIQPMNSKLAIDDNSLTYATELSAKLNLPLSVQLHKLLDWR